MEKAGINLMAAGVIVVCLGGIIVAVLLLTKPEFVDPEFWWKPLVVMAYTGACMTFLGFLLLSIDYVNKLDRHR